MSTEATSVNGDDVQIAISDIPSYLHESEFYRALDKDESAGSIVVPQTCFRASDTICDIGDFEQLLRTVMCWGVDSWPSVLIDFCTSTHISQWEGIFDAVLGGNADGDMTLVKDYFRYPGSIEAAIQTGRQEFIRHWMKDHPPDSKYGTKATKVAVEHNELELLINLHEHNYPLTNGICIVAAGLGHVECLKYLRTHEAPWADLKIFRAAADFDHLECVRYLHSIGCKWDADICAIAASQGSLNILKFLHTNGCPWDAKVCSYAARDNHLECLTYAHENGCPWDVTLTEVAAARDNVDCLIYALENGCPIHENAVKSCVNYGSANCIGVLVRFGARLEASLLNSAAQDGHLDLIKCLFEIGCPYDDGLLVTAASCPHEISRALECVKYLVEEQLLTLDRQVFSAALNSGYADVVMYLVDVGCDCTFVPVPGISKIPVIVSGTNVLDCVKYANEHGFGLGDELVQFLFIRHSWECHLYLESEGYYPLCSDTARYDSSTMFSRLWL